MDILLMEPSTNKQKVKLSTIFMGLYFFIAPLDTLQVFGGISILRILIILPMFFCIFDFLNAKDFKIDKSILWLISFIVFGFIGLTFSIDINSTIAKLSTFTLYALFLIFGSIKGYNQKEYEFLVKMFIFSSWFAIALSFFFEVYQGGRLTYLLSNTATEDQNAFGGYLLFAGGFYFYELLRSKKIFNLIPLIIMVYYLLLTGSRGSLLAFIVVIFILLLLNGKKNIITKGIGMLFAFFFFYFTLSIILSFLSPALANRFKFDEILQTGAGGRFTIWEVLYNYFIQSNVIVKFFGNGLGTVSIIYRTAHNNWLELLIETGIIGVSLFFAAIASFVKKSIDIRSPLLISILAGYITMTFSLSIFSYKPMWNLMLLILIAPKNKSIRF